MEYQVPQFIEVEDKIFGPFTLKQFIYLAGGAGISVILVLNFHLLGFILAAPFVLFSLALAFYKVNSRSFVEILESGFMYYLGGRLYLWKKDAAPTTDQRPAAPAPSRAPSQPLSASKLHDLAFSLDVKDNPALQNRQP
jgi:hypothetical protein